ncbi:hypothetical protein GSI_05186 [Ganoderma sinense ZZ0214-1]|uniref:Fungal-type protein kinase domain-containing protein n=1 Tax=Ganoderma sinense ZZ0214-1 TaxID=1077348 RepID=A0A2G8SFG0_9APHY|nr:hypothetical protein GSI_05186 [Ganoderma sinense ZZ0214-1]
MAGNIPGEPQESPRISRKLPSLINSVGKVTLPQYRAQSILDIAGRVVQADSVDHFLDELLPYPASCKRSLRIPKRPRIDPSNNPFRTLKNAGNMSEEKVVKLFAAALKKHELTPGMGLGRCQYKPDKRRLSRKRKRKRKGREDVPKVDMLRQKIDAALFRERYLPKDGRPHWPDQGVPVEFKGGKLGVALDAFQDQEDDSVEEEGEQDEAEEPQDEDDVAEEDEVEDLLDVEDEDEDSGSESGSDDESGSDSDSGESDDEESPTLDTPPLEPRATTRKEVRGQLTTYSELLQLIQHRVAVFMLLILGRRFRLLRWDRAGVIVTKSVDYFKDPDGLCEFLWRVSHLSDAALGFDPSAIRLSASDPEWDDMDQHAVARKSDVDSTPRVLKLNELPLPASAPGTATAVQPYFVFDYVRKMFKKSIADPRWPRFKLRVSVGPGKTRNFLVGQPVFAANGAVGRATRGYVAVDCETGRFVWLKDSWRAAYEGVEQEGLILQRLNKESSIKDVPTLVCHGDVFGQRTLTAAWWERANPLPPSNDTESSAPQTQGRGSETNPGGQRGVKRREREEESSDSVLDQSGDAAKLREGCRIRHHQHYRLVVNEVGMPLKQFQSAPQLVYLLLDCLTTHHLAATCPNLHILHRDISDSNIIILPKVAASRNNTWILDWTGILTDWETSRPIDKQPGAGARQPEHTGSWQFTSVNLLNHEKGVKIQDELESIFLILVYYSIRYLKSSISDREAVAAFLDEVFDCFTVKDGKIKCGQRKYTVMRHGKLEYYNPNQGLERVMFSRNGSPLDHLIAEILMRFSANYKAMKYDSWAADKSRKSAEAPPPPRVLYKGVQLVYDLDKHAELDDGPDADKYEAALGPQLLSSFAGDIPPEPTKEERDIGADVWRHRWMAWMFRRSLRMPGWESIVRAKKDRVPRGWVSPHPPIPHDVSAGGAASVTSSK